MPLQVVAGAQIACTFSLPVPTPSVLNVIPEGVPVTASGPLAATVMDFAPLVNIMPFGTCMAPTNPAFIAATSAALGVPTPVPCVPVTTSPWVPGAVTVTINEMQALHNACTCMCTWGGVITVLNPGQVLVQVT